MSRRCRRRASWRRATALEPLRAAARRRIDAGAELRAAAGDGWLLILGDDLPWADGCVYVGHDGPLLLPTTRALDRPPTWSRRALGGARG